MTTTAFLRATRVDQVLPARQILFVDFSESVGSLLQKLQANMLRCAVVLDLDSSQTQTLRVKGFVDAMDIAVWALQTTSWSNNIMRESVRNLMWEARQFLTAWSGPLVDTSKLDPFNAVNSGSALHEAAQLMATGLHRLAVVDNGVITNIISQSDIIRAIAQRHDLVEAKLQRTIVAAGLHRDVAVVSVGEHENVVAALKKMNDHKLSGIAVVNYQGRVIYSLSATDFLSLTEENFVDLALSVRDFFTRIYGFPKPPVVCRTTDTVENVMLKMCVYEVHRVFTVDSAGKAIGIITMTDLLSFFLSN